MSDELIIDESKIFAPAFYSVWNDFLDEKYTEFVLKGGRGCVDGETRISTPKGDVAIKDFDGGMVYAYDGDKVIEAVACRPIRYTREDLYRVKTKGGKSILVTDEHRFLTDSGWKQTKTLAVGDSVFSLPSVASAFQGTLHGERGQTTSHSCAHAPSASLPPSCVHTSHQPNALEPSPTISCALLEKHCEICPSMLHEDVLHLTRTLLNLIYRYWQDFRQCDGLPPMEGDTYQDVLQRLTDEQKQNLAASLHKDGLDTSHKDTHSDLYERLLSTLRALHEEERRYCEDVGSYSGETFYKRLCELFQPFQQSHERNTLHAQVRKCAELILDFCNEGLCEGRILQTLCDTLRCTVGDNSLSNSMKVDVTNHAPHYIITDTVESIELEKKDYYYDLFVPTYNNYIAEGFINHNSTKSSFVAAAILLGLEMYPDANAICYRKVAATQLDSCYSQFEYTLQNSLAPLADHWKCSKSPLKIVNTNTGQQILFRGLDDPSKSKSLRAPKGYFRFLWFEETAEFDGMEEIRSVMQSVLRGGQSFQTFYTYNPPMTSANWCNSEFSKPQPGRLIHHSDYRSVSPDWLGKNFFVMAENLRLQNERAYRHEYLGEVTGTGGAIFPNVVPIQLTDEEIASFSNLRWGLDLGFALDPTALVGIEMRKAEREIIIFDEVYQRNLLTHQIAEEIKNHHFGYQYVMCDSAAPLTIADLESQGCPVLGAAKGPDSIKHGILYLQSLNHIYIDVLRCPNTYKEFSMYEYEKNKAGQFLSKYPDTNNHAIDATRYGLEEDSAGMGLM